MARPELSKIDEIRLALPDAGTVDGQYAVWNATTQNWDAVSVPAGSLAIDAINLYTNVSIDISATVETDFQWPDTAARELSAAGVFTVNPGNTIITTTKAYRVVLLDGFISYDGAQRTNHIWRVRRISDNALIAFASHGYIRNANGHLTGSYALSGRDILVPAGTQYKVTFQREANVGNQNTNPGECKFSVLGFE